MPRAASSARSCAADRAGGRPARERREGRLFRLLRTACRWPSARRSGRLGGRVRRREGAGGSGERARSSRASSIDYVETLQGIGLHDPRIRTRCAPAAAASRSRPRQSAHGAPSPPAGDAGVKLDAVHASRRRTGCWPRSARARAAGRGQARVRPARRPHRRARARDRRAPPPTTPTRSSCAARREAPHALARAISRRRRARSTRAAAWSRTSTAACVDFYSLTGDRLVFLCWQLERARGRRTGTRSRAASPAASRSTAAERE